jgi:hypothetical protein
LENERENGSKTMIATHVIVKNLATRVRGVGHKLYMDNFFSSTD